MKFLPIIRLKNSIILLTTLVVLLLATSSKTFAASSYISPATGLITNSTFKVSAYVESSDLEPAISGATIIITHTPNVKVISISDGAFDNYLQKTFDPATNEIKIEAVNNSGSYKTGKVKLASITFESATNAGDVQLTIGANSTVSGASGEQLLTETINGVYSLEIVSATGSETGVGGGGETTTTTTTTESTTGADITTGGNSIVNYLLLSLGLIGLGIAVRANFSNPQVRQT